MSEPKKVQTSNKNVERYRELVDDWNAFEKACQEPLLTAVRRNPVKAQEDFEERLEREFDTIEQSGWNSSIYRLPGEKKPGSSILHWLGEYYVQEESAAIPAKVMAPEPGEKILDMCAAPGGKTTQIASKIENNGAVIANDSSKKRLQSLQVNTYRTGSACVTTTNYDGRNLPEDEKYDRILVDAPCSGEGDKARRTFEAAPEKERDSLSELQKQLVEKASRILKEDGVLVYSTCTIAPEENEEVVKHVLENTELEMENIELEVPHQRGAKNFKNKDYGKDLEKTVRIYPNHLESGVIYVAKFRK